VGGNKAFAQEGFADRGKKSPTLWRMDEEDMGSFGMRNHDAREEHLRTARKNS